MSFPYGIYDTYRLEKLRTNILKPHGFHLTYKEQSFRDGCFLPFTFDATDFIVARKKFRALEVGGWRADRQRVPAEEAWSGRFLSHGEVFAEVSPGFTAELSWYYDISSWENLMKWYKAEISLDKPKNSVLSYHEWNPIGVDNE